MAYNGKLVCYASGYQLRLYSKTMFESEDIESVRVELDPFQMQPVSNSDIITLFDEEDVEDPERSLFSSYARTKNMIYYLARSNIWTHFVTLTFSPVFVDRYDYDACAKKLKNWLDVLRRSCSDDLKYLLEATQIKISPELLKSYAYQILCGLSYCHCHRIIHR